MVNLADFRFPLSGATVSTWALLLCRTCSLRNHSWGSYASYQWLVNYRLTELFDFTLPDLFIHYPYVARFVKLVRIRCCEVRIICNNLGSVLCAGTKPLNMSPLASFTVDFLKSNLYQLCERASQPGNRV